MMVGTLALVQPNHPCITSNSYEGAICYKLILKYHRTCLFYDSINLGRYTRTCLQDEHWLCSKSRREIGRHRTFNTPPDLFPTALIIRQSKCSCSCFCFCSNCNVSK